MNARIKALIVDDEPLARIALATLLAEHGQVEIIGMAGGVKEARALLALHTPDVVFLDMEMPGGSGLELEPFLPASTRTIFVTAFADYALQAFQFGASDYLVKPVDSQRHKIALGRLERKRGPKHSLKILAGVFHRRHSSPTYDTYERIHFEDRPTGSPALQAGTEENHGGCLPGQRFERPALRGSSRRQLPDIGYLDQEGQAILHVHNSEFPAFRIPLRKAPSHGPSHRISGIY